MTHIPKWFVGLAVVAGIAIFAGEAGAQVAPDENKVEFWCNGTDGIKYEPVDTPFIVPAPPEGTTWTLIVIKAGTTNETNTNPIPGTSYAHSEHDNSHVILCWETVTTTTTTTILTTTTTTPTDSTTTTTTTASTTTTDPASTTSSSTTTTSSPTTTTSSSSTTTTLGTTTSTVPPSTPTTTPPVDPPTELPVTGANLMSFTVLGLVALLTGALVVWKMKAE